jgi:hypothetical protein
MQPGSKSKQFERALNENDLGNLGDPERWGGIGNIDFVINPVNADHGDSFAGYSKQFIRVQCADLTPRQWSLVCNWHIDGITFNDTITRCGLEISFGVGQASRTVVLDLIASLAGYPIPLGVTAPSGANPPPAFEVQSVGANYTDGTIILPWELPAVAIAIRGVLEMGSAGPPFGPRPIHASFFAAVAPRSI